MNTSPRYSVIVPVYNAENTLRRCVDSILDQGYQDVELILVNDGSEDRSGAICCEYAQKDSRVIYLDKPNGGVSSARNMGLDHASGKYVLFVDSDDYVSGSYFETLEQIDGQRTFDFVLFSNSFIKGEHISERIVKAGSYMDFDSSVPAFCENIQNKYIYEPWNKRYVNRIIQEGKLRFWEKLYIGEDKVFSLEYALRCGNACFLDAVLYAVDLGNENSLSRKLQPDYRDQLAMEAAKTKQILMDAQIPEHAREKLLASENLIQLREVYSEAKRMHIQGRNGRTRREMIRKMCHNSNAQKQKLPGGLFCNLLKIPVRLQIVSLIDLMGWYLAH